MERGTKAFVQVGCNGGAGIGIALRGGVAEEIVIVFGIKQLLDGLMTGAGTFGFPILKSKTFSDPISAARFLLYSKISRITDFFVPRVTIFSEIMCQSS